MAHELASFNGMVAYAERAETVDQTETNAWHGLGQVVPGDASNEDLFKAAQLNNWDIRNIPNKVEVDGVMVETGTNALILKADTNVVLAPSVTDRYHVTENETVFDMFQRMADFMGCRLDGAGALFQGRKIFMTGQMNDSYIITPKGTKDFSQEFLTVTHAFTGKEGLRMMSGSTRIVCANTLALFMSQLSDNNLRKNFRHSTKLESNFDAFFEAYKAQYEKIQAERNRIIQASCNLKVSEMNAVQFLTWITDGVDLTDDEMNLADASDRNWSEGNRSFKPLAEILANGSQTGHNETLTASGDMTLYTLFNLSTFVANHGTGRKTNPEVRFDNVISGNSLGNAGYDLTQKIVNGELIFA